MGAGIYMVWPAFYTDVTDAYRLPRRDRLRVDLGGLYFNAVVAVATMGAWLALRVDALLLLIGLQLLLMVKQLSPVIRADGYHILADATGIPDLYSHIGPTLRRLVPGRRREPSALTGRSRAIVTAWVLIVIPVLLSLAASAVLLFPRLATTAWDSGRVIGATVGHDAGQGDIAGMLASCVRLVALVLPVLGSFLVAQRIVRTVWGKAEGWSAGRAGRRAFVLATTLAALTATAWALWPAGQYEAIGASDHGTLGGMVRMVRSPQMVARPVAQRIRLAPGKHLAVALIPVGGASERHPAFFVIKGKDGQPDAVIASSSAPDTAQAPHVGAPAAASGQAATAPASTTSTSTPAPSSSPQAVTATAFPFKLPSAPGPGDSQALAVNTKDGAVKYDVAYSLVTVRDGAPVTNTNSAYAFASCRACTTVAVSFQVVLVVGQSRLIAPINAAGALNANCPSCITTAIADQIVVTLRRAPSGEVLRKLQADLQALNALPALGSNGTPANVAAQVDAVQHAIDADLDASGLRANQTSSSTTSTPASTTPTTTTTQTQPSSTTTTTTTTSTTPSSTSTTPTTTTTTQTQPSSTSTSTTPTTTSTTPTTTTDTTQQPPSQTTTTQTTTTSTTPSG
jgi:putative peptide zinc metalloprotease protein